VDSEYKPIKNIKKNAYFVLMSRDSLIESLADFEGSILSIQDTRRINKDKTAVLDFYGTLLKSLDFCKRVGDSMTSDRERRGLQYTGKQSRRELSKGKLINT
jgi:hypothetical protein